MQVCILSAKRLRLANISSKGMTFEDEINSALAQSVPDNAKTAFYQGIGFKKLGQEFDGFALNSFKRVIELDKDKKYYHLAQKYILDIETTYNIQKSSNE